MMENAGHAVAAAIDSQFEIAGVRVLILVGPGNNGGDGLVVARYLAQMGAVVSVYVWQRKLEGDKNWALLDATAVERILSSDANSQARLSHLLANSGIIVDALLGTGVSRSIEGTLADLLEQTKAAVTHYRSEAERELVVLGIIIRERQTNGIRRITIPFELGTAGQEQDDEYCDQEYLMMSHFLSLEVYLSKVVR